MSSFLKKQFGGKCIFLPDFSCDERWINDDEIELMMELSRDILRFIEIIEHKVRIFVERFVKLS